MDYFAGRRVKPGAPKYREDSDDDLDFLSDEEPEGEAVGLAVAKGSVDEGRGGSAVGQHVQQLLRAAAV